MTRREAERAVIEAAQVAVKERFARWGMASTAPGTIALKESVDALRVCTEPDLDALNAAVAEAADDWRRGHANFDALANTFAAHRAALAPKVRYEASREGVILDHKTHSYLRAEEVAALLNERKDA